MYRARSEREPDGPVERTDEELKRNRRNVLVVAVALLALAGITSRSSWFGATIDLGRHHHSGPLAIEAEDIYDAYRDDTHAAAKRFRGREMVVSGEFLRIVPDGQG